MPSLSPPDQATADELGHVTLIKRRSGARDQLADAHKESTAWGWSGASGDGIGDRHTNVIVRLMRRAPQLDSQWAPGRGGLADQEGGRVRVLWRGVTPRMASTLKERGSTGDAEITNGFTEHATAVDQGSKQSSAGVSLTKDPFIGARYAASSGGELICVSAEVLV